MSFREITVQRFSNLHYFLLYIEHTLGLMSSESQIQVKLCKRWKYKLLREIVKYSRMRTFFLYRCYRAVLCIWIYGILQIPCCLSLIHFQMYNFQLLRFAKSLQQQRKFENFRLQVFSFFNLDTRRLKRA